MKASRKFSSDLNHPSKAACRRGFTLIELLVVVAIIAMLIGILLPGLNKARARAVLVKDMASQKQLGTGMVLYADDLQGRFASTFFEADVNDPDGYATQTSSDMPGYLMATDDLGTYGRGNWKTWMESLYPYANAVKAYTCGGAKLPYKNEAQVAYNGGISGYWTAVYNLSLIHI